MTQHIYLPIFENIKGPLNASKILAQGIA